MLSDFTLFPTAVCPTDPADGILVIGTLNNAVHADEIFNINEHDGSAFGRSVGTFTCRDGHLLWTPTGQQEVALTGVMHIADAKRVAVGIVLPMENSFTAVRLYEGHALKFNRTMLEMLCPSCGNVQEYTPSTQNFACTICSHLLNRDWGVFIRQYHTHTSIRTALHQSRVLSRRTTDIEA